MSWTYLARIAVASLVLGALTSACTFENSPKSTSDFIISYQNFDSVFAAASLRCEDPNKCPGNVGLIVFPGFDSKGNPGFHQCTGTLIGEDVVLTASHCVPEDAKYKNIDCGTQLGFIRSASDRYPQKIRCAEILHFSADFKNTGIDYAVFRLKEKATANPSVISRLGVPDGLGVYSYTVDPAGDDKTIRGLLRKKNCVSVMNSLNAAAYIHPLSKVISLFGDSCMLIGGNSGSALMYHDEVRGVVSRGRETAAHKQYLKGKEVNMSVAVNLACRELPGFPAPPSECADVPAQDIYGQLMTTNGVIRFATATITQLAARSPLYQYRFEITGRKQLRDPEEKLFKEGKHEILRLRFVMVPVCAFPRSTWSHLGIEPVTSSDGTQVILTAPPSEGDLNITLALDDLARPTVQSRILNVTARTRSVPVSSIGVSIPLCPATDLSRKFQY